MKPTAATPPIPAASGSRRKTVIALAVLVPLLVLAATVGYRRIAAPSATPATVSAAAKTPAADEPVNLTFKALEFDPGEAFAGMHVTSNMAVTIPPEILALDGKYVRITGFLVPILNAGGHIREFFIMASQTSCCFGTPPRLFDFIDAKMPQGTDAKYMGDPAVFEGVLHVRKTPAEDEWIPLFTMDAEYVYRD